MVAHSAFQRGQSRLVYIGHVEGSIRRVGQTFPEMFPLLAERTIGTPDGSGLNLGLEARGRTVVILARNGTEMNC